jgi:phosphoribosyl 1,2-cyclic phosphodiesterase
MVLITMKLVTVVRVGPPRTHADVQMFIMIQALKRSCAALIHAEHCNEYLNASSTRLECQECLMWAR